MQTIVVIDDEEDILELLDFNLTREGYRLILKKDGPQGLAAIRSLHPDLVILDLMLPGLNGLDVCRIVKNDKELEHIPIVMLTVKGEEEDIVTGFELGADDYITKPFSIHVLVARVRAVLRRSKGKVDVSSNRHIHVGNLRIDPSLFNVNVQGRDIRLTKMEFGILNTLAENEGRVLTRKQLLKAVQGNVEPVTDRTIDVHLASLRKKLGDTGYLIQTVRGVGYRLKSEYEKK
jgi:two-component system alkaline phosphatase synthesis response regulator PhoP